MAFNFKRPGSEGPKNTSLGNIALEINSVRDDVDKASNAITGTNIETGEQQTIRLANAEEFARIFVPQRVTGPAQREAEAERAIGNRADVAGVTKSSFDEAVVQFDDVRETRGGDLVARWASSVTTNSPKFSPEKAANVTAEASTFQFRDKEGEKQVGMKITGVLANEAFPAEAPDARDKMERALSGQVGNLPDIQKSGLLVAVSEPGNDTDKNYAVLARQKDAEKELISGLEDNVTRQPVGRLEAVAQTAVAASTGIPFERLNMEKSSPEDQEWLKGLYQAVENGDLNVSVAPSFEAGLMPKVTERLEKTETNSNGLLNRGFVEMNIGIREGAEKPDGSGSYDASIREVKPAGFLPNKNADSFVKDRLESVASKVIDGADKVRERAAEQAASAEVDTAPPQDERSSYDAPAI